MEKGVNLISKGLFYGLFVIGIVFLFIPDQYSFVFLIVAPAVLESWLILKIIELKRINIKFWLPINIALWLNILGEMYIYYHWQYYDKFLHLSVSFLVTIVVYEYFSKSYKNKFPKKELVFFAVLGGLALWEIIEYLGFIGFNYPFAGVLTSDGLTLLSPYDDTMWDLIMGCIGTLLYLIFKKEKVGNSIKKEISHIRKKSS